MYAWRGGLVVIDGVADGRVRGCEGCLYIYDLIGYLLYLTGWLMAYCMVDSVVLCLAAGPVSAARGPLRRGAPAPNLSHSVPAVPRKSSLQVRITKSASTDRGPLFFMLSLDTFGTLRGDIGDKNPARNNTANQVISGRTSSPCPQGIPLYLLKSEENWSPEKQPGLTQSLCDQTAMTRQGLKRAASTRALHRICFDTASRRTCWKPVLTYAPSRFCLAMPRSATRHSTCICPAAIYRQLPVRWKPSRFRVPMK